MFAVSIAAKFVILLLQELPKASSSIFNQLGTAKKPTSSLLKQTLLWWPNLLFNKGHRNILTNSDLGDVDEEFDSRTLLAAITSTWANCAAHKVGKYSLVWVVLKTLKLQCLAIAVPRLLLSAFMFAQPFLINRVIDFVGEPPTRYDLEVTRGLIAETFFVYAGIAVTRCYSKHLRFQLITMIRGALVGIIYQKTLNLETSSISESAPVTLMSTDIDGIISATQSFHDLWPSVIEVGVGLFLLDRKAGHSSFLVLVPGISATVNLLSPIFVIVAAVCWAKGSSGLTASDIFTTLSMVMLVAQPISTIVGSYTVFISGLACCSRIQSFLLLNEKAEYRVLTKNLGTRLPSLNDNDVHPSERGVELSALYRFAGRNQSPVVDVRQATFTTKDQQIKLLREIEFQISTGSISMIVGRVGCGKSSLLKGILGELHMTSGTVHLATSSISYCDQTPWLRNISIRDNITGPLRFEKDWYAQVVSACALDRDFTSFPCGDQTLVGSGGISLSGGQRQRVGLARAVYSRSALVLLDDVFSGLDDTTSAAVFSALLGDGGLLRNRNITVLFATHSIQFLNNADFVTVLELGMIKYNQVKFDSINNELKNAIRRNVMKTRIDIRPNVNSEDELSKLPCHKASSGSPKDPDLTRQAGDLGLYMFYVGSIGPVFALILIVLAVSFSVFKKMPQIWIRIWTQHGIDEDKGHFIGIYLTFVVACFASIWLLSRAPLHFFTLTDNGSTLNRFSQDMTIIDQVLPGSSFNALRDTFNIITEIIIITSGARYVAAIIPFCTIRRLDLEAKSPLYTHFSETLTGLVTIRAMGWKQDFIEENSNRLNKSQRPFYLVYSVQVWLNIVLDFVVCGIATALVAVAVLTRDSTSKAAIGLALLNIISFNNTLSFLINSWTNLETSLGAVARLRTFLLQIPEEGFIAERQDPPADWPTMGDIRFNNVTSSYGPELAPTIRSVSLNIKAGQKVGICGRTGSGKSSLILTLLRLLDLRSGSLHIDGLDLSILRREAIRSRIITLPQEPVILPGTVRENLCPANQVFSDKDLVAALEKTGIWEVISFRGGLMAELDEIGLSVGQKQLFCLSRAVLHEAKILLLDEATSNLDPDTEQKLRRVIRTELADCTILEVAHKLEAIASYDLVIIMQDGEIVEMGDPRELLQVDLSGSV
ncbi:hypothetical protein TruAng_004332 [Truncatella angustata]|nr:hypothetical protein TruAng_004332 [Truncatella angustata]